MSNLPVHADRAHASLGASSASRWMACPGSVRLSEGMPNISSDYAREGTAAHELAEMCLRQGKPASAFLEQEIEGFEVTEDMAEAVPDPSTQLVFITTSHDTRFDASGVIRPLLGGDGGD